MKQQLRQLKTSLTNPLVITSLVLGILGAAPLWYSGIFMAQGKEALAGGLFLAWVLVYTTDALVTLTLLLNR